VLLTGLSPEASRRFHAHLRPWSPEANDFAEPPGDEVTDLAAGEWCLPLVFLGRFDPEETTSSGTPSRAPRAARGRG